MLIEYFLKERLSFATRFYSVASEGFVNRLNKIEKGLQPYDSPPYDESDEPPHLDKWQDAITGLQSVGITSLSRVSSVLQLYMEARLNRYRCRRGEKKLEGSKGWLKKWLALFDKEEVMSGNCPVDLKMLEQMVLVRKEGDILMISPAYIFALKA